jgi:ParB family chromosome partitioning protein
MFEGVDVAFTSLDVDLLSPGRFQTRTEFSEVALNELAADLKAMGINYNPIIIRPINRTSYEIIAGERRWRAAQIAGISKLMCLVGKFDYEQASTIAISENLQREDLNPIERATGFKRMIDELGFTQLEVANTVHKSRGAVANSVRLLSLNIRVRDQLISGRITEGHGKALLALDVKDQVSMSDKVRINDWSVRKLEEEVKKILKPKKHPEPPLSVDFDIKSLEEEISESLGHPLRIHINKMTGAGKLEVDFYNPNDFDAALERIRESLNIEKI